MRRAQWQSAGAKTLYRPIEAAIRWAALLRFEERILQSLGERQAFEAQEFPRWPQLHLCNERIFDGMANGELPFISNATGVGRECSSPDYSNAKIRHVCLKAWVAGYYPGEKPAFLFDEIERAMHPAVNQQSLTILLAEREATKAELLALVQAHERLQARHEALAKDNHALQAAAQAQAPVSSARSESTYLNIIGALLTLLLGKSPSGSAYSSFRTLDAVVSALLAHHEGRPGISERTLWSKLVQARRHLDTSRS